MQHPPASRGVVVHQAPVPGRGWAFTMPVTPAPAAAESHRVRRGPEMLVEQLGQGSGTDVQDPRCGAGSKRRSIWWMTATYGCMNGDVAVTGKPGSYRIGDLSVALAEVECQSDVKDRWWRRCENPDTPPPSRSGGCDLCRTSRKTGLSTLSTVPGRRDG